MTKRDLSRIEAFNATLHFMMAYTSVINLSTAFSSAFNLFRGKLNTLNATVGLQVRPIKGVIEDKEKTKKLLAHQFSEYGALLFSWASIGGNNTLRRSVRYTPRQLERSNDVACAEICRTIRNIANDNLADLTDYGIDANTIKTMDDLIDRFTSDAPAVNNAKKSKVLSGSGITNQIKEVEQHLRDHVDMFMLSYQRTNPEFFDGYRLNRKVTDPRTSFTKVAGIVTDKATKMGIAAMQVKGVLNEKTVVTETDENGRYQLKTPQPGEWKVFFFHNDYTELGPTVVEVSLGKKTELDLEFDRKN